MAEHGTAPLGRMCSGVPITSTAAPRAKGTREVIRLHFALHYKLLIAGNVPFRLSSPMNIPRKRQRQQNDEWSSFQTPAQVRARLKRKSCGLGLPLGTPVLVRNTRERKAPHLPRWSSSRSLQGPSVKGSAGLSPRWV